MAGPTQFHAALVALVIGGSTVVTPATIVGLNQIVTPEIQPAGVLAVSVQAQHSLIGNSQQIQFELSVTPRFEVAWFEGLKPAEGFFSAEGNLWQEGLTSSPPGPSIGPRAVRDPNQ